MVVHSGQLSSCLIVIWISPSLILISVSALQCWHASVLVLFPSCLANCSMMFMGVFFGVLVMVVLVYLLRDCWGGF